MSIEVGSVVEGVVSGISKFGAFIELPEGKVGLIHISEVADVYVKDVNDFLKLKDKVKVKVLSIDDRGKIGLSIKRLEEKKPNLVTPDSRPPSFKQTNNRFNSTPDFKRVNNKFSNNQISFEDKLSKFLKDSDERLTDLRRKTDSKRGGRGGSRRSD